MINKYITSKSGLFEVNLMRCYIKRWPNECNTAIQRRLTLLNVTC